MELHAYVDNKIRLLMSLTYLVAYPKGSEIVLILLKVNYFS